MREINFRAWDPGRKVMENCVEVNPFHIGDCDRRHWKWGEVELMQFTGLHDSKRTEEYPEGQKIYEGDIFPDHFSSKNLGVVKFGEYRNPWMDDSYGGHVGFYIDWKNDSGSNRKDLAYWAKISGVVGNICENPEILEVAE